MSFLKETRFLYRFLLILGISPFLIKNNKICYRTIYLVIMMIPSFTIIFFFLYASFYGIFRNGFSGILNNVANISTSISMSLSHGVHQIIIFNAINMRRNHIKIFTRLLEIDREFAKHSKIVKLRTIRAVREMQCGIIVGILILIYDVYWRFSDKLPLVVNLFHGTHFLQTFTGVISVFYVQFCVRQMLIRLKVNNQLLGQQLAGNQKVKRADFNVLFHIHGQLLEVRKYINKTFGLFILVSVCYDFIKIAEILYMFYNMWRSQGFSFLVRNALSYFFIVENIIKVVVLVRIIDEATTEMLNFKTILMKNCHFLMDDNFLFVKLIWIREEHIFTAQNFFTIDFTLFNDVRNQTIHFFISVKLCF